MAMKKKTKKMLMYAALGLGGFLLWKNMKGKKAAEKLAEGAQKAPGDYVMIG
jgi:hypothetical protein